MIVFAHRGLWKSAPENSLLSFKKAFDAGFGVELDIRSSRDGVPIIFHDPTLKRLFGIDSLVSDLDLSQMQQMTNNSIVTFSEFCDLFAKYGHKSAIHVKEPENLALIKSIISSLESSGLTKKAFLFDLTLQAAENVKKFSGIEIALSVCESKFYNTAYALEEVLDKPFIDAIWADEFSSLALYSEDFMKACSKAGKPVYAISPELHVKEGHPRALKGYAQTWADLAAFGVDGICTDFPDELKSFLKGETI